MCSISINDRDRVVVLVGHVEDLARLILREQLPRSGTAKRIQKPRFRPRPRVGGHALRKNRQLALNLDDAAVRPTRAAGILEHLLLDNSRSKIRG